MRLWCVLLGAALLVPGIALSQDEGQDDKQEEKQDEGQGEIPAEALPLPDAPDSSSEDTTPPLIEDLAVASQNPAVAPMITAVITDDWSGVEEASVYYRPLGGEDYQRVPLHAGRGGVFVARLPDGTQREGFAYYVEVFDAAKNGPARMGSPEEPFTVPAAVEGTGERLDREQLRAELGPVHPAFMLLSLGGGILAAAGAGVFWLDYANISGQLATEPAGARRKELENAALGDMAIAGVLSVVAVAGLASGVGLLIYAALEE